MSLQMALPQLRQLEVLHLDGNPEVGLGAFCHRVRSPLAAELSFVWLLVYRCFAMWLLLASWARASVNYQTSNFNKIWRADLPGM